MRKFIFLIAVLLFPAAGHATWREASTPHFLIYSQGSEKSLKQRAERLEAVHYLMLLADGLTEEPHPYKVRVYVVPDTKTVQRMMTNPSDQVAGFYQPRTEGSVAFTPETTFDYDQSFSTQVVLFHEYGHHFMLQNFPAAYPAWFIEGRAELISTASFEKPGVITYGKAASHRSGELTYESFSASAMVGAVPKEKAGSSEISYGGSWLVAHYLTFSPSRKGQLAKYLQAFNNGASMGDAAKVFGDPKQFDRDVGAYLRSANFSYRQVPIPATISQNIALRILPDDEATMLPLAMEFTKTMPKDAAKAFTARIATAAAQFPDSAFAQQLLAESQLDIGDVDAALKTTAHLVAIAPQSARAHYFRGAALLAKAEAATEGRGPAVSVARREIVAANKLDPDDPLPLIAYYHSYGAAGMAAPDIAVDGLARAYQIAPQNTGLRLNYVRTLIDRGNKAQAVATLKPLAYSAHGGSLAKIAQRMIDRLEGREAGDPNDVREDPAEPAK